MKKNHKEKMLEIIERRYMAGKNIEQPKKSHQMGSGKWQMTHGKQEWLTKEPLNGVDLEKWLENYQN